MRAPGDDDDYMRRFGVHCDDDDETAMLELATGICLGLAAVALGVLVVLL